MIKAIACAVLVGLIVFALVADRRLARRERLPHWFTSPLLSSMVISAGVCALFVAVALEINLLGEVTWTWFLEVDVPMVAAAAGIGLTLARFLVSDRSAKAPPPFS